MKRAPEVGIAVAALSALWLTACGQKGPLYLPDRGTVITRPAGAAAPGTAPTQGQQTSIPPQSAPPSPSDQAQPEQAAPGTPPQKPDENKDDDGSKPQPR